MPRSGRPGLWSAPQMPSPTTSADWIIPGRSDVDRFRDLDCVIDFDTEVANRALDLGMTKRELDCAQFAINAIDGVNDRCRWRR